MPKSMCLGRIEGFQGRFRCRSRTRHTAWLLRVDFRPRKHPIHLALHFATSRNCEIGYPSWPSRISSTMSIEKATFGAGCFWGVEAALASIPGVTVTAVGYEGGQLERPSYRDVCTDTTGHAEVVELDFDPARVSFEQLLDAF